jgi:hypothetical protein
MSQKKSVQKFLPSTLSVPEVSPPEHVQRPLPSIFEQLRPEIADIILRLLDTISISVYAKISKEIYKLYELYYRNRTAVVLYNPRENYNRYARSIEEIRLHSGCVRLKFIPMLDFKSSSYPMEILCLDQASKMPNGLECYKHVNALIIRAPVNGNRIKTKSSFAKQFKKLNLLCLSNVFLSDKGATKLSRFPSLECIIMNECLIVSHQLEKFERCITLKEAWIVNCNFPNRKYVKPPSQVKKITMIQEQSFIGVDLKCSWLESL